MVYHVFNRSIADFVIFNNATEFTRMLEVIQYYQIEKPSICFSEFTKLNDCKKSYVHNKPIFLAKKKKLVEIIAYCLMPTHPHLILDELKDRGVSIFINNILNSYTRYFNIRHKRKGPLWESRSKKILIKSDKQLQHLTRYIHLNPVTAYLVDKPEKWKFSSYKEYLLKISGDKKICNYDDILDIEPFSYKEFVEDRISYQRELAEIKHILIE